MLIVYINELRPKTKHIEKYEIVEYTIKFSGFIKQRVDELNVTKYIHCLVLYIQPYNALHNHSYTYINVNQRNVFLNCRKI